MNKYKAPLPKQTINKQSNSARNIPVTPNLESPSSNDRFEIQLNKVQENTVEQIKNIGLAEIDEAIKAINDDEPIKGSFFKQILLTIEAKINEFQDRLDNRDNLQELNTNLSKLKMIQMSPQFSPNQLNNEQESEIVLNRNKSQASLYNNHSTLNDAQSVYSSKQKESPHKRSNSRQNTLSQQPQQQSNMTQNLIQQDQNRIYLLEKKIRQMEEKQSQILKDHQEQYLQNLGKMEKLIKIIQEKKEQINMNELQKTISDVTESQTAFIQHLQAQTKEIHIMNLNIESTKDELNQQILQIKQEFEQSLQIQNQNVLKIQNIDNTVQSIDSDLLIVLKYYKDILNDLYKIDVIESQQLRIIHYLNDEKQSIQEPLEVLEKQDLTLTFQFQQLTKTEPDDDKTVYLKSQSSVIIQDEQKVNDKLQFAHNLSKPFICQQDCYAFMLRLRFPLTIHLQSIPFEVSKAIPVKEINFEASTIIIDNTLTFEQSILDIDTAPILDAESEEEPSFDEDPLEIDLPEIDEQHQVEEKIEEDEDQTIEKITQFIDLELKENITIEVKGEYVSKIIVDNYPVYFFLNEKLRKQEPQIYSIQMEGKEIQSLQLTTEEVQDQKIYLKSFALRALCDQRIESNQIQNQQQGNFEKKPTMEENELNIYEEVQLQEGWNLGQFVVHLFYSNRQDLQKNVEWLKETLTKHFPNIMFVEDQSEGFEAYIYGVGPVNKRDGSKRILLIKKDIEDWDQFNQEFQYRSLLIYDTLCCLINVYGSVTYLSIGQDRFFNENFSKYSKTKIDKIHLNPYKYVENIERERNRPTTGYKSVGRRA